MHAGGASPTSVASGGVNVPKVQSKLPAELRPYIREVEAKSGLTVHPKQRELLAQDLRETRYPRFDKVDPRYTAHKEAYKKSGVKERLINEWEQHTRQTWPTYPKIDKVTGLQEIHPKTKMPIFEKYQAHHINPQQLGGKHEWWNKHPVQQNAHQGGVHGKNSQLSSILQNLGDA